MAKKPHEHILKRDLERIIAREVPGDPENKSVSETLALVLVQKGLKGNLNAIEMIYDRVLGKSTQQIQHTGEDGGPIQYENLSLDSLVERLLDVVGPEALHEMLEKRNSITIDGDRPLGLPEPK